MYREDKATQMASAILKKVNIRMPYIKLLKLMYMADREMLITHAKPITYDRWTSMKYGPVLCSTYDLIKAYAANSETYWGKHIVTTGYDVVLAEDPGEGSLSRAEERIISQICSKYGGEDWTVLVDRTHELGEWSDPGISSNPITYREVLEVEGFGEKTIDEIIENIEAQETIARLAKA